MSKSALQKKESFEQESNILDAVRAGFEYVAQQARHVKIRLDMIPSYAAALPAVKPENTYDLDHHFIGGAEETASYVLCVESVNFGSGYLPFLLEEGWRVIDHSQYFTIARCLKRAFEANGPMIASDLAAMTKERCIEIFEFPAQGRYSKELADMFALSMRQLGAAIMQDYNGRFLDFVRASEGSANRLVRQLMRIPSFCDVQDYRGMQAPLLKRAQLAAAVLQVEFGRLGETLFSDIGKLTMFADNGVPHVLHMDGILEYTDELTQIIGKGEEIAAGSEMETEIRVCAGHAVELVAAAKGMKASDIDFILWHRSVEDSRYRDYPTHRTLSRFY